LRTLLPLHGINAARLIFLARWPVHGQVVFPWHH